MFKSSFVMVAGVLAISVMARTSFAQDSLLDELYGRGVHAYFRGQLEAAQRNFDMAIGQGSRDPRIYYFRGLVLLRSGQEDKAARDFQHGAALEFSSETAFDVGVSLERVQGPIRLSLERARRDGRLAYLLRRAEDERARYVQIQESDDRYVRKPPPAVVGTSAVVPANVPADPTDPFGDASRGPIGVGVAEEVVPPQDGADVAAANRGTGRENATGPAPDDPFGADPFANGVGAAARNPATGSPQAGSGRPASSGASTGGRGVVNSLFRAFTKAIPGDQPATGAVPSSPPAASGPAGGVGGPAEAGGPFANDDPFAEPAKGTESPPAVPPAGNAQDSSDDPFGANDDPFAAPPAEPKAEAGGSPAATPPKPADEDVDPFADDDPFAQG